MKPEKKKFLFVFIILFMACSLVVFSEDKKNENKAISIETQIDKIFEKLDSPASPGAAVAVVKGGMVVFRKGYGSAQLEYNIPITPSTIFHVASVSKQFTAMAISLLEARRKLSIEDDIHQYLPDLPDFGEKITIRHLLNHTSGIRDQWELLIMSGWHMDDVITQRQLLEVIKKQKELNFPPGDRYLYCNSGYTLLAEIVSKVSGKPFEIWVKENIFNPLGMSSSHFHKDHKQLVKNRAYSYSIDKKRGLQKSILSYSNVGATSLFTTVEDMTNWMRNFSDQRVGDQTVIKKIFSKGVLNNGKEIPYARGLGIGVYKGLNTVSHGGADAGFRSQMIFFPEEKFGVVVLSNLASSQPWQKAYKIADIYLADQFKPGKKKQVKKTKKKIKLGKKQLLACTGHFWLETSRLLRRIVMEKKNLYYVRNENNRSTLIPTSKTTFYLKEYPEVLVRFSNPVNNKFSGMEVLIPDQESIPAQRVDPFTPTADQLKTYTGIFYSNELDIKWNLSSHEGKLNLKIPRNPKEALNPLIRDYFSVVDGYGTLVFFRDKQGTISGFTVNTGRVVNLKFMKIE